MSLPKRTKRITTAVTAREIAAIRRVARSRHVKPSLLLRELSVSDALVEYQNLLAWDKESSRDQPARQG